MRAFFAWLGGVAASLAAELIRIFASFASKLV
jgi:hypothetical protein